MNSTLQIPLKLRLMGFWSWWTGELADMLPEGMRRAALGGQRLFLEMDGQELIISRVSGGETTELGRYPVTMVTELLGAPAKMLRGARELVFCLPEKLVLSKQVSLPLAAEENLKQVLTFEMDRQTPFKANQVYYDFSVLSRDRNKRTLEVQLIVAPRREIDALLAKFEKFGIHLDRVTSNCGETGERDSVNLLPDARRPRKAGTLRGVNIVLGLVVVMLLIIAISLPIWGKRERVRALEPQVVEAAQAAKEAGKLREEVDRAKEASSFLVEKKRSSLLALQLINELTRLLPDDTWISHLELKGNEVQIRGQSMASAALIPIIESSSLLQNARFRSPVTQNRQTNSERFHLSADIQAEGS